MSGTCYSDRLVICANHFRYHGKCLKIARGKVKDDEKYTCPICDWRVRIPRDAARPKLEDLQAWQDEIVTLPFQPDEEDILSKIIDNAQEFRSHVAPYCNSVMATADESETQRFYLRKIEGAEILLAYETNFFRQELHKWSPVAPEPPPVLENSKSTRKPRPTKLQKLMAQHGVDDPEQLPQNLRTKPHHFKRKSSEPSSSRPQPLQPAPGRSDSGTPTSHTFPSGTASMLGGPILMSSDHGHHQPHLGGYASSHDPAFTMSPQSATSPAFAPHAFMHAGGLPSPAFGPSPSPRAPGMFNEAGYSRMDNVALGPGEVSPMRDAFTGSAQASGGAEVAQMFNDLTHDPEEEKEKNIDRRSEDRDKPEDTKWRGDYEEEDLFLFDGP
jgi:histone demethylase JARID1